MRALKNFRSLVAMMIAISFTACGGSSGGDSFVGAGNVKVTVSPNTIDTGDRTLVTAEFNSLHPDGVSLKFLYPSGLTYIPDTAIWTIRGKGVDAAPDFEVAADITQSTYLVYFLSRELLGKEDKGKLEFELRGVSSTGEKTEIQVDVDVLEEGEEFTVENPEFSKEASAGIRVR